MRYEATIMFFSSELGGRVNPPVPGYHPQLLIRPPRGNGAVEYTSCLILPRGEPVERWDFYVKYPVYLEPLAVKLDAAYQEWIRQDMQVVLTEGSKVIGIGKMAF